jgi:hypothetical protein
MAKKKYTVKKAKNGLDNDPRRKVFVQEGVEGAIPGTVSTQSANDMFNGNNEDADILKGWLNQWGQAGWDNEVNGSNVTFSKPTGHYNFHPIAQGVNTAALLTTGIANRVNDAKAQRREEEDWIRAIQPNAVMGLSPDGFDDRTMYTKHGGMAARTIEAEEGEVYQTPEGDLKKVNEGSGTHEEGGYMVHDAQRVLEDTSDKRKDKHSKALLMQPDEVEALTGHRPKSAMSHSKAMEFAASKINKDAKKIETKLRKNVESIEANPSNKFAQNSLKFNMDNLANKAPEGEVFDLLFNHQEIVKENMGTPQSQGKYKLGGPNDDYRTRPPQSKAKGEQWVFDENAPDPQRPWKRVSSSQPSANSDEYRTRPPQSKNAGDNWVFDENAPNPDRPWRRTQSSGTTDDEYRTRPPQSKRAGDNWVFDENAPNPDRPWRRTSSKPANNGDAETAAKAVAKVKRGEGLNFKPQEGEPLEPVVVGNMLPRRKGFKYEGPGKAKERSVVAENPGVKVAGVTTDQGVVNGKSKFNFLPQPKSTFNEPLNWFDMAGPIQTLMEGRTPVKFNDVDLGDTRMKRFNPLPSLQAGQRDYNAALDMLPENSQGYANPANLF